MLVRPKIQRHPIHFQMLQGQSSALQEQLQIGWTIAPYPLHYGTGFVAGSCIVINGTPLIEETALYRIEVEASALAVTMTDVVAVEAPFLSRFECPAIRTEHIDEGAASRLEPFCRDAPQQPALVGIRTDPEAVPITDHVELGVKRHAVEVG